MTALLPMSPWRRASFAIGAVLSVSVAIGAALWIRADVPDAVFFSVDGGVKQMMVDQLARGVLERDLHPRHEDELGAMWRDGMFPAPMPTNMVHPVGDELVPGFPWTFPALSALPYALFGPAGLRLLPMVAFFGLVLAMAWLGWRSRWGGVAVGAAVVATSIACPLVLYAGMFWEHSPAVLLCFVGFLEVALPARPARRPWLRPALLGGCMGAAFWLRPEAAPFAAAVTLPFVILHAREPRRWLPFAGAALLFGLAFLVQNQIVYGHPLGLHGAQSIDLTLDRRIANGRSMLAITTDWTPFVLAYAPVAVAVWSSPRLHRVPGVLEATIALPLFVLGTAAIAPNDGGHQLGARYLLPIYPLVAFLVGAFVHGTEGAAGRPARILFVPLLLLGLASASDGMLTERREELLRIYGPENLPCYRAVVERPADDVLAFTGGWYAAHLSGSHQDRYVVVVPDARRLARAVALASARGAGMILVAPPGGRFPLRPALPPRLALAGRCGVADVYRLTPEQVADLDASSPP